MSRPKLLIIGDFVKHTGFARVNEALASELADRWDIAVLAVNYKGDVCDQQARYRLYPAFLGGDLHGIGRLADILRVEEPDACLFVCDPWIGADYARALAQLPHAPPSVLYTPVDALKLRRVDTLPLNRFDQVVAYTQFGAKELAAAGLRVPIVVIPHGIDLDLFRPIGQAAARQAVGLPLDTFAVLILDQNNPRKRLDIAFDAFARFAEDKPDTVRLVYHGPLGGQGKWDILGMAEDLGIDDRLILPNRNGLAMPEEQLAYLYSMCDVKLSCCAGEGWGLCVAPDTWITTDRGTIPMRDVQLNDFVIAEDGNWHTICGKIAHMKHTLHIRIQGTPQLTVTPEHPFYRLPKRANPREYYQRHPLDGLAWVRADTLIPGDFVAMPRPKWNDPLSEVIDLAGWVETPGVSYDETSIWCEMGYSGIAACTSIRGIQERYGVSKRVAEDARRVILGTIADGRGSATSAAAQIAEQIAIDDLVMNTAPLRMRRYVPIDDQFLLFMGWYLAEGSTDAAATRVELDFNLDELSVAEALAAYAAEVFGVSVRVEVNGLHTCRIRISSRILATLMNTLCGKGSYNKRVHPLFLQSADKLAPMIAGYVSGDGHQEPNGVYRVTTASTELAWQFRSICAVAGIFVSITQRDRNGNLIWDLAIGGDASARFSAWTGLKNNADVKRQRALSVLVTDEFLFIPVRSIADGDDQEVMDISVADTHSFMGNGVLLHNTTMEAMACGLPNIVPDFAALGEWAQGAVDYIGAVTPLRHVEINTVGMAPCAADAAAALEELYQHPMQRTYLRAIGRALVERPQYRWSAIANQFDVLLRRAMEARRQAAPAPLETAVLV